MCLFVCCQQNAQSFAVDQFAPLVLCGKMQQCPLWGSTIADLILPPSYVTATNVSWPLAAFYCHAIVIITDVCCCQMHWHVTAIFAAICHCNIDCHVRTTLVNLHRSAEVHHVQFTMLRFIMSSLPCWGSSCPVYHAEVHHVVYHAEVHHVQFTMLRFIMSSLPCWGSACPRHGRCLGFHSAISYESSLGQIKGIIPSHHQVLPHHDHRVRLCLSQDEGQDSLLKAFAELKVILSHTEQWDDLDPSTVISESTVNITILHCISFIIIIIIVVVVVGVGVGAIIMYNKMRDRAHCVMGKCVIFCFSLTECHWCMYIHDHDLVRFGHVLLRSATFTFVISPVGTGPYCVSLLHVYSCRVWPDRSVRSITHLPYYDIRLYDTIDQSTTLPTMQPVCHDVARLLRYDPRSATFPKAQAVPTI